MTSKYFVVLSPCTPGAKKSINYKLAEMLLTFNLLWNNLYIILFIQVIISLNCFTYAWRHDNILYYS